MTNKFFSDFLCLSSQVVYLDTPNKTSQDSAEVCYYMLTRPSVWLHRTQ